MQNVLVKHNRGNYCAGGPVISAIVTTQIRRVVAGDGCPSGDIIPQQNKFDHKSEPTQCANLSVANVQKSARVPQGTAIVLPYKVVWKEYWRHIRRQYALVTRHRSTGFRQMVVLEVNGNLQTDLDTDIVSGAVKGRQLGQHHSDQCTGGAPAPKVVSKQAEPQVTTTIPGHCLTVTLRNNKIKAKPKQPNKHNTKQKATRQIRGVQHVWLF